MIKVGIYIQNADTLVYDRVDLFDDEKISVTSSIQNVNDISKTFTDYSQTFSVPASKTNNKIFKHWYENSRVNPYSTLARANGRIDIDGLFFRSGKIQLESCEIVSGQPKSYSINFIGVLASLKDKFAGKYLKDLNTSAYDFLYTGAIVMQKVTTLTPTSPATPDIGFPLITSNNLWTYGSGTGYRLDQNNHPVYYNDLFPSVRLIAMMNMIATTFGITFTTNFSTDKRFLNAHLYLKNAETFSLLTGTQTKINLVSYSQLNNITLGYSVDLATDRVTNITASSSSGGDIFFEKYIQFKITPTQNSKIYTVHIHKNGTQIFQSAPQTSTANVEVTFEIESTSNRNATNDYFEVYIGTTEPMTFNSKIIGGSEYENGGGGGVYNTFTALSATQTTPATTLQLSNFMPDMKVEDFFTGILKMFNLTCYSENNGVSYIIKQLETFYNEGADRDFTPYIKADKKTINRVKTYKKVNFEYEKSESFVNKAFLTNAGIDYGSLFYQSTPIADGEEYSIKLPFENLNFQNLGGGTLQVGYSLKTDFKPYTPKPIILYDYTPSALTTAPTWHFSTNQTGNATNSFTVYKAFGQEFKDTSVNPNVTYSLNFNEQQSTLTNQIIQNGLFQEYYSNYFLNIYDFKARLIKVSAILPTSVLVSLKLNDSIFIRGDKFIINTVTMDLTTGETQLELLSDQRL